jgi:hypothetical protein
MYHNKLHLLTLFFSLFVLNSFGQISVSYSFGGILSSEKTVSSYTGPMIVNGGSCFTVSNGVNTFSAKSVDSDEFSADCKGMVEPTTINYNCYPNPIISYTTITAKGKVDFKQFYILTISNSFGQTVHRCNGTMDQLVYGKNISFDKYGSGFYVIRIVTENNTASVFKVIKVK